MAWGLTYDTYVTTFSSSFCDQELSQLVEKQHAVWMKKRNTAGRGRGARGRGRGGRGGRGRGRKAPKDKMSQLAAYFV